MQPIHAALRGNLHLRCVRYSWTATTGRQCAPASAAQQHSRCHRRRRDLQTRKNISIPFTKGEHVWETHMLHWQWIRRSGALAPQRAAPLHSHTQTRPTSPADTSGSVGARSASDSSKHAGFTVWGCNCSSIKRRKRWRPMILCCRFG